MTYQERETLLFRGESRPIRSLPLEPYLDQIRQKDRFAVDCSDCWRGYVGTWEARDDEFHLIGLETLNPGGGLAGLFPGRGDSVKATWFSGPITPDDVGGREVEDDSESCSPEDRPIQTLWFSLLVHRGDVLLEESVDQRGGAVRGRLTRHVERLFPADEMDFLTAIRADVNSSGPKSLYAGWLEERGDPRPGCCVRGRGGRHPGGDSRPESHFGRTYPPGS